MKKLIIAEKPSLAVKIKEAISGNFSQNSGYYENDKYIITFAFGHLYELKSVADYTGITEWSIEQLPFVPEHFEYKAKDNTQKQIKVIKDLVNRADVECIVNAGDADREGEIIIRLILDNINNEKPVKRLWLPDQTAQSINIALNELVDDSCYDNLAAEGFARTYSDWAYGINLSRLLTLKKGIKLPAGRVLIPIVKEIYDRDKKIENFTPEKYWQAEYKYIINNREILLTDKNKYKNQDEAKYTAERLNNHKAIVKSVVTKEVIKNPGKLFSLATLQSKLSTEFKMDLTKSLETIQKLYEKGYLTYPRTNTEYLAVAEQNNIAKIINQINSKAIAPVIQKTTKNIYDDSKIESHSAITPTTEIPKLDSLTSDEAKVYSTVLMRFICVFYDGKTSTNKTTLTIGVGDTDFKIEGETIKNEGFFKYEPGKEKIIPQLEEGTTFDVNFSPKEKITEAPKHHTVTSLTKFLEHPFKKDIESENDDEDYKLLLAGVEIGTAATRTPIIANAIKYHYIKLDKNKYYIEPNGKTLIETLEQLEIDFGKTKSVDLSKQLKQVYNGEMTIEKIISLMQQDLQDILSNAKKVNIEKVEGNNIREVIGQCPRCGQPVYEGEKNFYCSAYKNGCQFSLWKNNKFFECLGKKITAKVAKELLSRNQTAMKNLKSKSGNTFDAVIEVEWLEPYPKFQLNFDKK